MLGLLFTLAGITSTITQLERQFNQHFQYPYVFLNDVPFEQVFWSDWSTIYFPKTLAILSTHQIKNWIWASAGRTLEPTTVDRRNKGVFIVATLTWEDGVIYRSKCAILYYALYSSSTWSLKVGIELFFFRTSFSTWIFEDIETHVISLQEYYVLSLSHPFNLIWSWG